MPKEKKTKICGDLGFVTKAGHKCTRRCGWGLGKREGPCKYHAGDRIDSLKKSAIIDSLRIGATITEACDAAKISRSTFYFWKDMDEEFNAIVKEAQESAIDRVEEALVRTAREGNVTAMIFFLCNRRRSKWQHVNRIEVTGPEGKPLETSKTMNITVGIDEYEKLLDRLDKQDKAKSNPDKNRPRKHLDSSSSNGKTG